MAYNYSFVFGWQTAHLCFGCHMQNSLSFVADLYFLTIPYTNKNNAQAVLSLTFFFSCCIIWKNASTGVAITPSDSIRVVFLTNLESSKVPTRDRACHSRCSLDCCLWGSGLAISVPLKVQWK